jgi:putative glutamine amidotransferase
VSSAPQRSALVLVSATTEPIRDRQRVRLNAAYVDALAQAGLTPLIVPPLGEAAARDALASPAIAGLVLTGGEDLAPSTYDAQNAGSTPPNVERDATELALALAARDRGLPTLGICRGAQVINVAFGGTLIQDITTQVPGADAHDKSAARNQRVHGVRVRNDSRLSAATGARELRVNSSHHQALDQIGVGLIVVASAPDGIVEAVETTDPGWWMLAVQWHPEELTTTPEPWDRNLFAAFASAVRGG